jgi:hypothetical protein
MKNHRPQASKMRSSQLTAMGYCQCTETEAAFTRYCTITAGLPYILNLFHPGFPVSSAVVTVASAPL